MMGLMKMIIYYGILSVALIFCTGCNNNPADSAQAAKDSNSVKIDSANSPSPPVNTMPATVSKDDSRFVVDAVLGGMMEIQLGQLARQKGSSQQVRDFGAMMEGDHTRSGDRLKGIAEEKSITLAVALSPATQKKIDDLKTDKNFDKDYISLMVDDHKDDIKEFEEESKKGSDADIRAFADSTLHMLHIHLDSAESCHRMIGKN
jgi:putative membrane protein